MDADAYQVQGLLRRHVRFVYPFGSRAAFEVRTRSEYLDYLPALRAHTRRYLRHVAEAGLAGRG